MEVINFPGKCVDCGKRVDAVAHIHFGPNLCTECIEKAAIENISNYNFPDWDLWNYLGIGQDDD